MALPLQKKLVGANGFGGGSSPNLNIGNVR